MSTTTDAKTLIDDLASTPRPAGSEEEARARLVVSDDLRASGFTPTSSTFSYSAFPGMYGTMAIGIALLVFWSMVWWGATEWNPGSVTTFFYIGLVTIMITSWLLMTYGIRAIPWMRRSGINLVAIGQGVTSLDVRVWLVAHIDSKWQPVSVWMRALGVLIELIVALAAVAYLVASASMGAQYPPLLQAYALVAMAGTLPLILSVVGTRSQGALDNASGVAAILLAARELGPSAGVGVLITSAEELGLAGAIAWAGGVAPGRAINCDTVDDGGALYAMWGRRRGLIELVEEGDSSDPTARSRHIPLGILVDAYALDRRGWDTITVARGNRRTLRRIHTSDDRPERLTGEGAAEAARFIEALVRRVVSL